MKVNQEFELFVDQLLSRAVEEFKSTERIRPAERETG